jgi:ubiquinone/menaquinone biosynthesis C-methylase UbiE
MAITDPMEIKNIVRSNFNKSAELYENFELKYGLFRQLTNELAEECEIRSGDKVCDIGCGTGTSSLTLSHLVGPGGKVYGVDFSEDMLKIAKMKANQPKKGVTNKDSNIEFILSDAVSFSSEIDIKLDSVLFNACIFLIPDHIDSIQNVYEILRPSGTIGMNYLIGIFDKDVNDSQPSTNLFEHFKNTGEPFAPYGRQIVNTSKLTENLTATGFIAPSEGATAIKMSLEMFREFYSIPAQSAGLWPKNSYEERLENINETVEYFNEHRIKTLYQYWGWCLAKK